MSKPQPGQYIYLKCFSISKFTWHPFIVTSAPEEPYISIHIRTVGNWTKELVKRFEMYPRKNIPRLGIDGPYGSPIDDVFKYDSVILVAAGIGGMKFIFEIYICVCVVILNNFS
jgi:predicted ferric reductase